MEELVLIDGNSLLFKAFYATSYTGNYMVNRNGIPTNGVYGFARMVEKIISTNPKYVIVAFDCAKKTLRNEFQPIFYDDLLNYDYGKITLYNHLMDFSVFCRRPSPDELIPQLFLAREYLTAHNITWYDVEGFGAYDTIGTLVNFGEKNNMNVSIFTGDKYAYQLISSQTNIYRTVKGVTEFRVYDEQNFFDQFGLKPNQINDFLGLMGDGSEKFPGIKGVGEKTALKFLRKYETLEGIKDHQDELKSKMGEKIKIGIENALKFKKAATICRDVPLDVDLKNVEYNGYDYETLKLFFEENDMESLVKTITIQ